MYGNMREIEIRGGNAFAEHSKTRSACRCIAMDDGKLLLGYLARTDTWLTPGGGLERGESLEDCCIRETLEETGYIVKPRECFLKLEEYYEEWKFVSYYFLCDVTGKGERKLTGSEIKLGLQHKWLGVNEALDMFSRHADYDGINEEKRGIYQREFIALSALAKRSR